MPMAKDASTRESIRLTPLSSASVGWKRVAVARDRPKRPLCAYNFYFQSERQKILSQGRMGFAEMARTIAASWKKINPKDKEIFEAPARKDKLRYNKEMAEWKKENKRKRSSKTSTPKWPTRAPSPSAAARGHASANTTKRSSATTERNVAGTSAAAERTRSGAQEEDPESLVVIPEPTPVLPSRADSLKNERSRSMLLPTHAPAQTPRGADYRVGLPLDDQNPPASHQAVAPPMATSSATSSAASTERIVAEAQRTFSEAQDEDPGSLIDSLEPIPVLPSLAASLQDEPTRSIVPHPVAPQNPGGADYRAGLSMGDQNPPISHQAVVPATAAWLRGMEELTRTLDSESLQLFVHLFDQE